MEASNSERPAEREERELLKRAVVALERKLRGAQSVSAGLERELEAVRAAAADLPSVQAALQQARAAAAKQQQRADSLARDLAGAKADAAEAAQQRDRARAALESAQTADEERCHAAAQRRAEEQAATQELAMARGQAEVLAAQVQQLEGANAALRQDNQQHAERLRQAFEREGELLAELAELQAKLRAQGASGYCRQPPPPAAWSQLASAAGAGTAKGNTSADGAADYTIKAIAASAPTTSVSLAAREAQMEQQLLMAAAQQLTEEYTARLAQAEGRARQLEQQMQALGATVAQLQLEADRQAAAAAATQLEAAQERQAAQALLDNNLRLHEAVAQLMEDGLGCWGGLADQADSSGCGAAAAEPVERAQGGAGRGDGRTQRAQQEQLGIPTSLLPRPAKPAPRAGRVWQERGSAKPAGAEGGRGQHSRHRTPAATPPPAEAAPEQRQQQPAHRPAQLARPPPAVGLKRQQVQAPPTVDPIARQAAIKAALAVSAEHRELHSCYQAVAEELRQVASAVVAAPASKQLALLRQHAALQQEQRDLAQQLEDKVVQLAALKQAGVL